MCRCGVHYGTAFGSENAILVLVVTIFDAEVSAEMKPARLGAVMRASGQ